MSKRIVMTALLCTQLLVTPQAHAWQMPVELNAKQIWFISTITAAIVGIIGYSCYTHRKSKAPVVNPVQESIDSLRTTHEILCKTLQSLKAEQESSSAHREQQNKTIEGLRAELAAMSKKMHELIAVEDVRAKELAHVERETTFVRAVLTPLPKDEEGEQVKKSEAGRTKVIADLAIQVAELKARLDEQLGETSLGKIFDDLSGEIGLIYNQIGVLQKGVANHSNNLNYFKDENDRRKAVGAQQAITIGEVLRQLQEVQAVVTKLQQARAKNGTLSDADAKAKMDTSEKIEVQELEQDRALSQAQPVVSLSAQLRAERKKKTKKRPKIILPASKVKSPQEQALVIARMRALLDPVPVSPNRVPTLKASDKLDQDFPPLPSLDLSHGSFASTVDNGGTPTPSNFPVLVGGLPSPFGAASHPYALEVVVSKEDDWGGRDFSPESESSVSASSASANSASAPSEESGLHNVSLASPRVFADATDEDRLGTADAKELQEALALGDEHETF